jgi:hypothetical protein
MNKEMNRIQDSHRTLVAGNNKIRKEQQVT